MSDPTPRTIELQIEVLETRLNQLAAELECERKINQEQTEQLAQRQDQLSSQQRSNRRWIEVIGVAIAAFFGFTLVILTGLRLEFGWGSFALPANLLESSAIAALATAGSKYFLDKQRG